MRETALLCVHILRVSNMIRMFVDCTDYADLRTDMHITNVSVRIRSYIETNSVVLDQSLI